MRNSIAVQAVVLALSAAVCPASGQVLRLGTIAPEGTYWHEILLETAQQWRKISGGKVRMTIFPGGVQGTEAEMLRKVRFGQLHAVALSGVGLPEADKSLQCLALPMLYESYEEFDYVLERVRPQLEARLEQQGFIVLQWSDAGWIHFFTKRPATTLAEIRRMKLFISDSDPQAEQIYKELGFNPVPIASKEILTMLQTGVIEAFDVPPLFALANQSFALANHMIDVRWSPLAAATVISRKAWEGIAPALRPTLLEAARAAGEQSRGKIRKLGDEAVIEMQKRGLNVIRPDSAALAKWRSEAEAAYPKLRGAVVPAEIFDEVVRLRNEFRRSGAPPRSK